MFGKKIRNVKIWIKGKRAWTDSVCCIVDNATIIISHLLSCPLHGLSNNEISWYHHCLYISWRKHHHFPLEYHNIYLHSNRKRFSQVWPPKESDWQYKLAFSPGNSHNMQLNFFSIFSENKSQSIKKENKNCSIAGTFEYIKN